MTCVFLCALAGNQVEILFLHHIVYVHVLHFAHGSTDVLCEHLEEGHVD